MLRIVLLLAGVVSMPLLQAPLVSQAVRTVTATTAANFGGPQDNTAHELNGVSGAIRTDDGRYVVANSKPAEIRVYRPDGSIEGVIGRTGEGPGEFRGVPIVRHWPGDSVLTFSTGTRRWMLFSLDGELIREWPLGEDEANPFGVSLVGGAFLLHSLDGAGNCLKPLVRRLVPSDGPIHQGMIDEAGRIWLRPADNDVWRIHSAGGTLLGELAVKRFAPTEVRGNHVVGIRDDEDGFQYLVDLVLELPGAKLNFGHCDDPAAGSARGSEMRSTVRNLMTLAEFHYAKQGRYPSSIDQAGAPMEIPDGLIVRIDASPDGDGYVANVTDPATGFRCLVSFGSAIRTFPDGVLACGG